MQRIGIVVLLIMTGMVVMPARHSSAQGAPVTISSVTLFDGNHFRFKTCTPAGSGSTTFPNTVVAIYALVSFSVWDGKHTQVDQWTAPGGGATSSTIPLVTTNSGPMADCDGLPIAKQEPSVHLGTWQYKVFVDGQLLSTATFTLSGGSAPLTQTPTVPPTPTLTATPRPTATPQPRKSSCGFTNTMNYYAWRLWKLLTQLQGIDEEMGVAAAQTLQNATDGQALAVWNAVGKYEKSHPLPSNWRVADSAMMRVVNDLYKATQTLVDDAQRLEDNTSGGVTSVTVLNLGHVVYAGLGDLTTLNGAIGQLGACASKPAAKPTAKPTPRPTPRSAVQTGNGSGPGFHGSCYAFRAQLWKLNTQTAKAYGTYDSTLAAYTNGSLSEADTLSLLAQLRHALDGGNVGNPKLPGLVQAITTTNVRYGLAGWGNLKGPYAWAAFKTFLAADDLSSTVDPIVTGNDLAAAQIYGSIYSEGKRNVNYAWDALKQLRCKS